MGRKGEAWSFVTREDQPQIEKISSTWNMAIPVVDAPPLPDGVERDRIGRREDWEEVSDVFGMVTIRLSIGKSDSTKRALVDWITGQARVSDIVIGEISQSDDETKVEVHVEKVAYVLDVIKAREFNGKHLTPTIVGT
jgi:superfamily II DNA/RNA helicase